MEMNARSEMEQKMKRLIESAGNGERKKKKAIENGNEEKRLTVTEREQVKLAQLNWNWTQQIE